MACSVKFRRVSNPFQAQVAKDTNAINKSTALNIPDKTTNLYKVEVKDYEKLLQDSITITYQKVSKDTARKINMEAKQIAEQTAEQKAFITIKDNKPNFSNNIKCRLINPAKSNLGKISKQILQKITHKIRQSTGVLRWRGTVGAIRALT